MIWEEKERIKVFLSFSIHLRRLVWINFKDSRIEREIWYRKKGAIIRFEIFTQGGLFEQRIATFLRGPLS